MKINEKYKILRLIYNPISHKVSACLEKAKKFCSYEWAKLMQNRPLKSDM
jgi:hypothetical protein